MKITACFKTAFAAILAGMTAAGCSAPESVKSENTDTYVCREIDSYHYDAPLPETAESADMDALIAGDTRIGSFEIYGDLETKNCEVCYTESMNIFQINQIDADGHPGKSLYDLMMETEKKNIYILVGLNEIGYENYDSVADQIQWLINELISAKPDTRVCFILNYTPSVYYGLTTEQTIERTGALNAVIKELAEKNGFFFLDLNPVLAGEDQMLKGDYTYDGIHLNPEGVAAAETYILTHALNGGEYVKEVCE